ncbi:MAG: DUF4911 domain-containing protein [Thermincola sp.]|nr:DUF4911 domain-containing protein [Thermincola sp.]MDT3703966.1 DUF4911 domain-containing protein [Thermincola sp.]
MKRYRGKGCVSRIAKEISDPETCVRVRMLPGQVNFFIKIMEAHSHLVFISPINPREGVVALSTTPDNMLEVKEILGNFPHKVDILE